MSGDDLERDRPEVKSAGPARSVVKLMLAGKWWLG
jgi:hypothetical protein